MTVGIVDVTAAATPSTPFVSVIVPVFRDSGLIETCVRALTQQTYPQERYEIIVVDNGGTVALLPVNPTSPPFSRNRGVGGKILQ